MNANPLEYRLDLVEAKVGSPVCLVIGAMDGIQFDTLGPRIQKNNWRAVMVEPMPTAFSQLCENFKNCSNVTPVPYAVGKGYGTMDMYYVDPAVYKKDPNLAWMQGISTLNPNVGDISQLPKEYILKQTVDVLELTDIMATHNLSSVNILQVDTEGHDVKVLMQFPFERIQPELVIFEYIHVTVNEYRTATNLLNALGYRCVEMERDLVATKGI